MFEYLLFDVFAEAPFQGNQLAVFPHGETVGETTMQTLAKELNLAESIFLMRTGEDRSPAVVRIFTPGREMPFAGHPTIGATIAISDVLRWVPDGVTAFVLKERIGEVEVQVERSAGATIAWLKTPPVTLERRLDRTDVAAMLGLRPDRLRDDLPPQIASAGNPFVYVALRDPAAVDDAALESSVLRRIIDDERAISGIYLFAQTPDGTYGRMFAPMSGIAEDPATGSAVGPLYAYLRSHGALEPRSGAYVSVQGEKMGRRSVLHARIEQNGGAGAIFVGGRAIHVGSGSFTP